MTEQELRELERRIVRKTGEKNHPLAVQARRRIAVTQHLVTKDESDESFLDEYEKSRSAFELLMEQDSERGDPMPDTEQLDKIDDIMQRIEEASGYSLKIIRDTNRQVRAATFWRKIAVIEMLHREVPVADIALYFNRTMPWVSQVKHKMKTEHGVEAALKRIRK